MICMFLYPEIKPRFFTFKMFDPDDVTMSPFSGHIFEFSGAA